MFAVFPFGLKNRLTISVYFYPNVFCYWLRSQKRPQVGCLRRQYMYEAAERGSSVSKQLSGPQETFTVLRCKCYVTPSQDRQHFKLSIHVVGRTLFSGRLLITVVTFIKWKWAGSMFRVVFINTSLWNPSLIAQQPVSSINTSLGVIVWLKMLESKTNNICKDYTSHLYHVNGSQHFS